MKTMKNNINILFTSSGRRVELVKHFMSVIKGLDVNGKVITVDIKDNSPAGKVADKHILVPRVNSEDYIPNLLKICKENCIDLLIPLIDTELLLLAENKDHFEAIGVKLLLSDVKVHEICNDKQLTAKFFEENNFGTPKIYDIKKQLDSPTLEGELLIKPSKGSSGFGVHKVSNKEELKFYSENLNDPILQEFIRGEEYTIDVFTDLKGKVLTAVPRLRIETRAGEVSKGKTCYNRLLIDKATEVVNALANAIGCITVQCFLTENNDVKFIEINPRFGGGAPLSLTAGADYAKYLVETLLNREPSFDITRWQNNLLMLRYDAAIFLEEE